MAFPPSLIRIREDEALREITLSGSVIDLGGGKDSGYRRIFKGEYTVTSANLDGHATTDIHCDLEEPLPIADRTYNNVLLINVLEHIYHARELMAETARIITPGGKLVIAVPFLFPVHPSPSDYWRFTGETLKRLCADAGYTDVVVTPLAAGVLSTRFVSLDRLMPQPIRVVGYYVGLPVVLFCDHVFTSVARMLGRRYNPSEYPTGYLAVGIRK